MGARQSGGSGGDEEEEVLIQDLRGHDRGWSNEAMADGLCHRLSWGPSNFGECPTSTRHESLSALDPRAAEGPCLECAQK